ncbi:NIN-like protein [Artemisia annua]|uniref:NIN-like protein n=1 Tax=Artemisia annua TaxID=35608 RepID=A0A2U1PU18_ARTAN|nr:NIN-like protein [Artemisia annua]
MGDSTRLRDEEVKELSAFLECFPTYHLYNQTVLSKSYFSNKRWVFSSQDEGSQNISSADDHGTRMIYDKIKSAFSNITIYGGEIVQFWAPHVTIRGRWLLSTSGQPFSVAYLSSGIAKYRKRCEEYGYNIDVTKNNKHVIDNIEQHDDHPRPMIIFSGASASAFLNRLTEVVRNASVQHREPLARYAFEECKLNRSYMMPIFCPSQCSYSCIGVVECSSWYIDPDFANATKRALEEVGLFVFDVQHHIPYKAIIGLEPARDEIQEAIKSVCELHQITLAQVWIAYENVNRVPFSSSLDDTRTKQKLAFKLTGYSLDKDSACFSSRFKDYYDACDIIAVKIWEEIKEFPSFKPHFREKVVRPSQIIMFKLFQYGRITSISQALERGKKRIVVNYNAPSKAKRNTKKIQLSREDIENQYGKTMEEAAKILGVSVSTLKRNHNKLCNSGWQGPDLPQRNANNTNRNQSKQSQTNEGCSDPTFVNRNEITVTIKAEYADDMIKFYLPISEATFVTVKNIIGMKFKLTLRNYKLKYLDEDSDWILIDSDQDLSDCIKSSRKVDRTVVRLCVFLKD